MNVGMPDKQKPVDCIDAAVTQNDMGMQVEQEYDYSDQELRQALGHFVISGPGIEQLNAEAQREVADRSANLYFGSYRDRQGRIQQMHGIVDSWHLDEPPAAVGSFWSVAGQGIPDTPDYRPGDARNLNRHRGDRGELSYITRIGATAVRVAIERYNVYSREPANHDMEFDATGNLAPVQNNVTLERLDPTHAHYAEYVECLAKEDARLAKVDFELAR